MRELVAITGSKRLSSVETRARILCFLEHGFGHQVGARFWEVRQDCEHAALHVAFVRSPGIPLQKWEECRTYSPYISSYGMFFKDAEGDVAVRAIYCVEPGTSKVKRNRRG